jgi:DNA-binding SARP family transcriptional activator/DNA-binding beta-propeller fold protein YncE
MAGTGGARRTGFRILGQLEVLVDGDARPVPGDKLQVLLARLLLERSRSVATDRLIDDLWGERPPETARQSLHAHVARLRRLLADEDGRLLANDGRGYVLHVDGDQLDAERFRMLVAAARDDRREGRAVEARRRYREALELWRGPLLDGVELDGVDAARAELDGVRLTALEERIDIDLRLGAAAEIVPELEQLVLREPLRERLWAQLMLALYASGRQTDALAAYQDARRTLGELGLEPSPRLRELEQAILNHDPSLATSPLHPGAARSDGGRRRALAVALAAVAVVIVVATVVALRDEPPSAAGPGTPRVAANSLVEIDPATNEVVSVTKVGQDPESIAVSGDSLWVANVGDRTVARVGLATKAVRIVGGAPVVREVTNGLNGDIWLSSFEEPVVTMIAQGGRIAGEDPHTLAAAPVRVKLPGSAEGLAVGGGYLWVTSPSDSGGRDTVFQIDLRTRRLAASLPVGHLPLFVAFGYGSAWVSNYRGDSVSVVRPGSSRPETISVPGGPLGIAAGGGAIWVVTFWSNELVRIDPETRRVLRRIPVGAGPLAVTAGADAVWVTNRDDKTITRIDPRTNRISRTIRLAAAPYGIRVAHGRVWVTTQQCGSPIVECESASGDQAAGS